jgi:hypothetical protein
MNKNGLINLLPVKTQEDFFSNAHLVELKLSQVIGEEGTPSTHVYFPTNSFISMTQRMEGYSSIEVGMIGREGLLGSEIALGVGANSFGSLVQGSGYAWKIDSIEFMNQIKKSLVFSEIVNSYLAVRMSQLGLSIACEHYHEIGPRLAKWLLMSQDRAQSATFFMTHEFISLMLGVRREGVTGAAVDFRRRDLIDYHRGEMRILNRVALKAEACSCYLQNRKIYASIMK